MSINQPISRWFTGAAAGILCGLLTSILIIVLQSKMNYNIFSKNGVPDFNALIIMLTSLISTIVGVRYAYKLFNLPQVKYYNAHNTFYYKLIAAVCFGSLGYYVFQSINIIFPSNYLTFSTAVILPAMIGFFLGYRILLLPPTLKGLLKTMMIGVIAFTIVSLFFALSVIFTQGLHPPASHADSAVIEMGVLSYAGTAITLVYSMICIGIALFLPKVLLGLIALFFICLPFHRAK